MIIAAGGLPPGQRLISMIETELSQARRDVGKLACLAEDEDHC
jgi:hypothetical protein